MSPANARNASRFGPSPVHVFDDPEAETRADERVERFQPRGEPALSVGAGTALTRGAQNAEHLF